MLISVNWLRDFVDIDVGPEEVARELTMAGLEVEGINRPGAGLDQMVVGKILKIQPHPNAEKLVYCHVDVGQSEPVWIVCGATNMKEGDHVPTALVGSTLPGDVRIKKTKIRGIVSHGMMCSSAELKVGEDASGLLILNPDTPIGKPISEFSPFNDSVLDIDVLSNRPDALSQFGVAREVAVLLGKPLQWNPPEVVEEGPPIDEVTSVEIADPDLCGRYAARVVQGITIGPSPPWLADRLTQVGIRPINNVVDVTNYVLMELGQPLHAFDYDLLRENRIVVRRAEAGEKIRTLDGEERTLAEEMLVIADAERPVALAGIMGGGDTEVSQSTRNILLESANFNPRCIRRTANTFGITTESSYRFEREVDPELVVSGIDRAAQLIGELAGGKVCKGVIDCYPGREEPRRLTLRPQRVNQVLGTDLAPEEMRSILETLGLKVEGGDGEPSKDSVFTVEVPTFRRDVEREIDLIEEIARIHGYGKIPSVLPKMETSPAETDAEFRFLRQVRRNLTAAGLCEAVTYGFTTRAAQEAVVDGGTEQVEVANPIASDQEVLRSSLLPGLLAAVSYNLSRQLRSVKLFEVARIFSPTQDGKLPQESLRIVAVITGPGVESKWPEKERELDFYDIKGIAEHLLKSLGIEGVRWEPGVGKPYHPDASARALLEGVELGRIGLIQPKIAAQFEVDQEAYGLEMDGLLLKDLTESSAVAMKPIPRYPAARRDLAIVLEAGVAAEQVEEVIRRSGGQNLEQTILFDVYQGDPVPKGKKSLAYALTYRSESKTLSDKDVEKLHNRVVNSLEKEFEATLR